jgi:superfamily I DNA and/or RNA helicase
MPNSDQGRTSLFTIEKRALVAMNMSQRIMNDIIEATKQERQRIEEPKNRSRYFIFGKIDERLGRNGYSVTFENVPDRVLRDAVWATRQGTPSLFKVGDVFIPGTMEITSRGIHVSFSSDEINRLGIEARAIQQIAELGIDYVMDNRDLMDQLLAFLESKAHLDNSFLEGLLEDVNPAPLKPIGKAMAFTDLNPSQQRAVEKALVQRVTFFWGPPGTGKTKTMAALAAGLIKSKKRVLLTALSNMALDQLFLTTVERLERLKLDARGISLARLGSTMHERSQRYSRTAFTRSVFGAKKAGIRWGEHVRHASLVAGNFAMLTFPRAADPGKFDYVIADEVSMASIPSLAAASFFATMGMVVGGDPLQLPPIYPEDTEEPNEWFRANVFEKAEIKGSADPRAAFLNTQYRMQTEIGDLVSEMFYKDMGGLKTGTDPLPIIGGFGRRVAFIDSPGAVLDMGGSDIDPDEQRRFNEVHAEAAVKAVLIALRHGVDPSDIGIIAPYNAQVVQILQKLRQSSKANELGKVKVSTVHSFQGQERRVMVVDFTDDNVAPTYLTAKWQLINVALSRAQEQLIIVGNREYLMNKEYFGDEEIETFKRLLSHARILRLN